MNRMKRENRRKTLKEIESILHPTFKLGEIEILHEHMRNGQVRFTAWKGNDPVGPDRAFTMGKAYIVGQRTNGVFYAAYKLDWDFLAGLLKLPVKSEG